MSAAALTALLGSGTGGGSLLNAGVGAASGLFGSIGANKRQKRAIAAQKEENRLAREWQKEMAEWYNRVERENLADERAYNNPSAVMARLKDAGLNPDLIYGNGASGLLDCCVLLLRYLPPFLCSGSCLMLRLLCCSNSVYGIRC